MDQDFKSQWKDCGEGGGECVIARPKQNISVSKKDVNKSVESAEDVMSQRHHDPMALILISAALVPGFIFSTHSIKFNSRNSDSKE